MVYITWQGTNNLTTSLDALVVISQYAKIEGRCCIIKKKKTNYCDCVNMRRSNKLEQNAFDAYRALKKGSSERF